MWTWTAAVALLLGCCLGAMAVTLARGRTSAAPPTRSAESQAAGVTVTPLRPHGVVRVDREEWSATTDGGPLDAGVAVRVVARRGLRLHVRRAGGGSAVVDKAFRASGHR